MAPNLDTALGPPVEDPMSFMADVGTPETMTFAPITSANIHKIILELNDTGAGIDGINTKLLKLLIPVILTPLTHLINLCVTKNTFPSIFKQALITPIFKAGSRTLFSNYRPISILPVLSKVLETVMYQQLMSFVNNSQLLSSHQFGFRAGHSSYMPIALLQDFITSNITDKQRTAAIYLDLARAFDTVNIDILLKKLSKYGLDESALSFLQSYLGHRTQQLRYNGIVSGVQHITCGVPQGSILGPLLFLFYVNDVNRACNEAEILLYADDTALLYAADTLGELQSKVSRSFPKICRWLHANRLSLSISKTVYQLYAASEEEHLIISSGNSHLKRTKTVKYLGVLVDDDLKFKSHISRIGGICSRTLGVLYRSRYFLNAQLLLLLYNALILPHLTYCSVIWGSNYESNIKPLYIIQKRAIRLISNAGPTSHSSPLFKNLRVLKLNDLIKYQTLLVLHSFLFKRLPISLTNKFTLHTAARNTRSSKHFNELIPSSTGTATPNYRVTNYRQFVIFYRGPVLWNTLLSPKISCLMDIPSSPSLFKKCLKILFIDAY